jgi:aryl-alcohol dehydrogenase-like predicted oxidoreductase
MMQTRPLGRTGLDVSVVGIGAWQFGGEWGRDFTQREVDAILDAGTACGINLVDTAGCYGDHLSERLIGDYLARHDRSRWIVATKFGHHFDGFLKRRDDFSLAGVQRQLDASLRALRVDVIDLYQFHSGPDEAFANEALWTWLRERQRAGVIRHLGVSLNTKTQTQAAQAAERGIEVIQAIHNRIDRRAEQLHFPFAERDGLGVLARVPLASGLLSGKYHPGAHFPANDVRTRIAPDTLASRLAEVERIARTEVPAGVPMAPWALAWCLVNPLVAAVIPGCKSPAQVQANAAAAAWLPAAGQKAEP